MAAACARNRTAYGRAMLYFAQDWPLIAALAAFVALNVGIGLLERRTVLIVPQRPQTVAECDRVYVMAQGCLAQNRPFADTVASHMYAPEKPRLHKSA